MARNVAGRGGTNHSVPQKWVALVIKKEGKGEGVTQARIDAAVRTKRELQCGGGDAPLPAEQVLDAPASAHLHVGLPWAALGCSGRRTSWRPPRSCAQLSLLFVVVNILTRRKIGRGSARRSRSAEERTGRHSLVDILREFPHAASFARPALAMAQRVHPQKLSMQDTTAIAQLPPSEPGDETPFKSPRSPRFKVRSSRSRGVLRATSGFAQARVGQQARLF